MSNPCFDLLKEWCDSLIDLQIKENKRPELFGGILCPACGHIHGRCADAIYPMLYMADRTGDKRYLQSALDLYTWVDSNMSRSDGSYYNDTNQSWKGITVFFCIQLGESLMQYAHLLSEDTIARWAIRLEKAGEFIYTYFDGLKTNINYPITLSAAMAVLWKITDNEKYLIKAKELAQKATDFIAGDGLIFGEASPYPFTHTTPKGCRAVDLGYNVEESLPGLVTYAKLTNDTKIMDVAIKSMQAHLEFMLPDGGWDNSWGSRIAKWTYWGSRTSDGCQAAYGVLADKNPAFAQAAWRNFLLYKKCTYGGLLHGGPMYVSAYEPACVHHTFCHAKSLAIWLRHGFEEPEYTLLPRENADGIKHFPTVDVSLLAKGDWRATVSGNDFEVIDGGNAKNALTMLWHKKAGPVLAAGMTDYYMTEPYNMQLSRHGEIKCQTPRLEYCEEGEFFSNINDKTAEMKIADDEKITVSTKGILRDKYQDGEFVYSIDYAISKDEFFVSVLTNAENAVYKLPVISSSDDRVEIEKNHAVITSNSYKISIKSESEIYAENINKRSFNPVGGFQALELYIKTSAGRKTFLTVKVY